MIIALFVLEGFGSRVVHSPDRPRPLGRLLNCCTRAAVNQRAARLLRLLTPVSRCKPCSAELTYLIEGVASFRPLSPHPESLRRLAKQPKKGFSADHHFLRTTLNPPLLLGTLRTAPAHSLRFTLRGPKSSEHSLTPTSPFT